MSYQLQEINRRIDQDVNGFLEECDAQYAEKVSQAADAILANLPLSPIVLLSGPSGSGKTTTALKIEEELERRGVLSHTISLDNYFKTLNPKTVPRTADGSIDFESPKCLDMDLLNAHFSKLSKGETIVVPHFEFARQMRNDQMGTPLRLGKNEVAIFEGIHALNPELTSLVPGDQIYRVYAGLREEYCIDGRRTINTQDIRLCRRTLRDAATRGRSPAKTLAMWDRVLDGETRYIKGFKTTADFLLDTSFTYELGLISNLLGVVRRQFTLEGHNAELWDETARRFEHVAPLSLDLLPPDSMLREFYGGKV